MKSRVTLLFAASVLVPSVFAASPVYKVVSKIKIGGTGGWDYVSVDSGRQRLYVSHGTQTEVIDTATEKKIGTIPGTNGVHGIAIADDLDKGFVSDGRDNDVTVFDLKTLQVLSKIKTGQNPDSIIYEPLSHRVFTFNGRSKDSTVIDAKTLTVAVASLPVGGKPEFAQVDGKGHVFANIEDTNELITIEAKDAKVIKRYPLAPCESPSGLAIDPHKALLFSVCENKTMAVSDPMAGKVIATPAIGSGPDGVAFDDGYAFSANGQDGDITMVGETAPGQYAVIATIPTARGARTIAADPKRHKLYLPTAELSPVLTGTDGTRRRSAPLPDSFAVIVVGR